MRTVPAVTSRATRENRRVTAAEQYADVVRAEALSRASAHLPYVPPSEVGRARQQFERVIARDGWLVGDPVVLVDSEAVAEVLRGQTGTIVAVMPDGRLDVQVNSAAARTRHNPRGLYVCSPSVLVDPA
jgi:hypothetical protein